MNLKLVFTTYKRQLEHNIMPPAQEETWGKPAEGKSFLYDTEFKTSAIVGGGNGWYAKENIPKEVW